MTLQSRSLVTRGKSLRTRIDIIAIVGFITSVISFIVGSNIIGLLPIHLSVLDEYHGYIIILISGSMISWCCTLVSFFLLTKSITLGTFIGSVIGLIICMLLLLTINLFGYFIYYADMIIIFLCTFVGYLKAIKKIN